MHLAELTAYRVLLPLRKRIAHASAAREASENVIVRCRLADGTEGWGEGVPREYVTGETPQGALEQFAATPLAEQLGQDCRDWQEAIALCESIRLAETAPSARGCHGHALRCALELSLLDAFGRLFGEPVSRVTWYFGPAASLRSECEKVRYSGAITAETPRRELLSALKMRLYGFAHCKVKVGMAGVDDVGRLRRLRRLLGPRIDLRVDANEAWPAARLIEHVEPLLAFGVSCFEQPVPHAEAAALAELRRTLPARVMLDESLTSVADAREAISGQTADLFNIRLSKCGGFLNSLRLAALAKEAGLGYQLGCHPGESGILSAAGRHWACSVADVQYLEGSYDRHILYERLTREDMTFGFGGWAPALHGPGLGITVDAAAVERVSREQRTVRL